MLAGCGTTVTPTPSPTPGQTPLPSPSGPSRPASQPSRDIGARFQSGPFVLTVGEAVHDTVAQTLYLAIRFENLSNIYAGLVTEAAVLLDGQELSLFPLVPPSSIPPGLSSDITYEVSVGEGDPLKDGVLRWGRSDETQTTIRLADGAVEGFGVPRDLAIDGWGQIGREAVHLTGAVLFADAIRAPRAPTGQHVLRLVFDEFASSPSVVNGFVPSDQLTLAWPDGTTHDALSGSDGRLPQMSWTSTTGNYADFAVPADPAGQYQALLASVSRSAMGTFHTDLIDRVPISFALDQATVTTSPPGSAIVNLPRAILPPAEGDPAPVAVDLALTTGEVNLPGIGYRAKHLRWDPATATASIDGEAWLMKPVVPPDDGLLSTPSIFQPWMHLRIGDRLYNGTLHGTEIPTITPDAPVPVTYDFAFMPAMDPAGATLFLGQDYTAPSVLPLVPDSGDAIDPPLPVEVPVSAPAVSAGNYTVQLESYRLGLPREGVLPPTGMRALEVIFDVTAHQVENPGAFGLLFATGTQLFLTAPDGYLQQAASADTAYFDNDGETRRVAATFFVPASWNGGTLPFTVRSRDEIRDITGDHWTEVSFGAEFEPLDAQPTEGISQ